MEPPAITQSVKELMLMPEPPDAIFSTTDRLTAGCLTTLRGGWRVPQDVAVAGFTNLSMADLLEPALTSVTQPAFEMGQQATDLLIQLIESKRPVTRFETRVLETALQVRASSLKGQ